MKPDTPPRQRRVFAPLAIVALLAGCTTYPGPTSLSGQYPAQGAIIPDTTVKISETLSIPLEKLVYWGIWGAAAYLILDPLSPNWEIEQADFPEQHVHMALKMKRFYSGGAGEARQVFHQRAKDLMRRGGYDGYRVLEYSEGLESSILGSQRVSHGVVQLTRKAG